ncbi:DUF6509 family protein [Metabacillus fastidiosus]|uniref:DUF6509 family protein n=1 Tax=Metabacillus fastidiosus TaxID=1458 RepID=UPI001F2A1D03|nr:DUF6509 family protein [Metabacillus fastidiosus]MED4463509.1 DUF6509 family protein [Metabacillus fastidiosus]
MMEITNAVLEEIIDPTGILQGERYEVILQVNIDEDDDIYTENGIYIKVIYAVQDGKGKIAQYYLIENKTEKHLDFALEEEEEKIIDEYCQKLIQE